MKRHRGGCKAVVHGTRVVVIITCSLGVLTCSSDSHRIKKGEASLRLGDHAMAIGFFDEVLHHNPENFDARLGMGKALIQQASCNSNDSVLWADALTHLEAARSLRPQNDIDPLLSESWIINARRLIDNKDTINALGSLSRAIDLHPGSVEALNLAGIIYFRRNDVDKAHILFNRALAADSTRSYTWFNIGMLQWAVKEVRGAHAAWFKALEISPQDKDILYWYSVAEKTLQETDP